MTVKQAWQRGLQAIGRHPWLALIPLAFNLIQVALAWAKIPLGYVSGSDHLVQMYESARHAASYAHTYGGTSSQVEELIRIFFPSWLPSVTDMGISIQPESLAIPIAVTTGAAVAGAVLVPFLYAAALALFLILVAQVVTQGRPIWREALLRTLRATPRLYVIFLLWNIAYAITPASEMGGLTGLRVIWLLAYPLLPLVIAAGDRSLIAALQEAPGALWSEFWPFRWLGWAWRTLLTTLICHAIWVLLGKPMLVGLLIYPFVGTMLIAAATALYLSPPAEEPRANPEPVSRRWWATLAGALLMAAAAFGLARQWEGYRVTRELALEKDPFQIVKVEPQDNGRTELVLYRINTETTRIAELARNRFGWKRLWWNDDWGTRVRLGPKPARITTATDPNTREELLFGEVTDDRIAAVEVFGLRHTLSPKDPFFIIRIPEELTSIRPASLYQVRYLDAEGNPIPVEENAP